MDLSAFCIIALIVSLIALVVVCYLIYLDNKKCIESIKQNKIWNWFISASSDFKFSFCHKFKGSYTFKFDYGGYVIIVWTNAYTPYTTVHLKCNNDCVLSSYNKEKSQELAQILLNRLKINELGKSLA